MKYPILNSIFLLMPFMGHSQGFINNGAFVEIGTGAYLHIDGGPGIGNFTNQDIGGFTGIIESRGTIDVSGDWTNLSSSNVFNSNTGAVRLIGANQSIQGNTPTFFNNLTLMGSGIKTLQVPTLTGGGFAAPAGTLNLTSLPLDLNGFKLTVNNPSTTAITTSTGYIISETPVAINPSIIQWNMGVSNGSYNYPFGVSGASIPVILNKISGNGNVSISTRATPLPDNTVWHATVTNIFSSIVGGPGEIPVVIDRWWEIDPSSPVTAMLSLSYRGVENTTTYNPGGAFAAINWDGVQWLPEVGSGPGVLAGTAIVTVPATVLTTSPWVLSNIESPLPIELLDFTARCNENENIEIKWSTASEKNNQFFILEKSSDGKSYDFLATIPGKNNSSQVQQYMFTDYNSYSTRFYYRLSQTDFNGQTEFFTPVLSNDCSNASGNYIQVWSSGEDIHIGINSETGVEYNTSLYDAQERLIYAGRINFQQGRSEIILPATDISRGVYFLNLKNNHETHNYKVAAGEYAFR